MKRLSIIVSLVGWVALMFLSACASTGTSGTTTTQPSPSTSALQTAANDTGTAAVFVGSIPTPYTAIAAGVLGLASTVLGIFAAKQTSKAATAEAVITQAAPGVAALVSQATDGQKLATDITTIAGVSQGVIALLNHPAATVPAASTIAVAPVVATPIKGG